MESRSTSIQKSTLSLHRLRSDLIAHSAEFYRAASSLCARKSFVPRVLTISRIQMVLVHNSLEGEVCFAGAWLDVIFECCIVPPKYFVVCTGQNAQ